MSCVQHAQRGTHAEIVSPLFIHLHGVYDAVHNSHLKLLDSSSL